MESIRPSMRQKERMEKGLGTQYTTLETDIGNVDNYEGFLSAELAIKRLWLAQSYPFIKGGFGFVLPAIFGAIYAQFSVRTLSYGAIMLILGIGSVLFDLPYS